ncbi:glycine cleavage system p-protein [Anaeramoeba flamelloides]|uniref:glycine dehydrogenase (aminomethyl-transferring) n=1 Tax=Anaeramoeba flamelloides TaxID=1746091 RepID=A0AAV7ZFT2_9EUKA|nr:glycine cleavage system p-protein [Anaeramoeba flamelloides]
MLSLICKPKTNFNFYNLRNFFSKGIKTDFLDYKHRYLPQTGKSRREMLKEMGLGSINDLFSDIPKKVLIDKFDKFDYDKMTEEEVFNTVNNILKKNTDVSNLPFFLGAGVYKHNVPSTVDYITQRGEFLTAYTPYQPEVSQGTLTAFFEFQTQVARITGMQVANASMYDGSTALGEAVLMACRSTRRKKVIVGGGVHPHYVQVIDSMTKFSEKVECQHMPPDLNGTQIEKLIQSVDKTTACVVVQNPSFFGHIHDLERLAAACHKHKALLVVGFTEVLSLGAIQSMGEMGADIAAGEGQSIGIPMSFGGPHLGLFSTSKKLMRTMPGRLVGETTDLDGKRAFVLTLGAREQHIRRDKATSNICTSSGICAIAFTVHLTSLGETGFKELAYLNHNKACKLAEKIVNEIPNIKLINDKFFNEFTIQLPFNYSSQRLTKELLKDGIVAGLPLGTLYNGKFDDHLLVACTETNTDEDMDKYVSALKTKLK